MRPHWPSRRYEKKRRYFVTVVMMMMMMMMIVALFGQDVLLVGDSAGMVVHGHDTTLPISLDMMISHCQVTIGVVASINIVRVSLLCILFPPQSFPLFLFFFSPPPNYSSACLRDSLSKKNPAKQRLAWF